MSEFDDLDDVPPPPKRRRVPAFWLWLILVGSFAGLGTVLYFQYGVWFHPIHEPTDLDLVEMELNDRLGTPFEILSSETVHSGKGEPLLRVKYRQRVSGGGWLAGDRVYCIQEGRILWAQDYRFWKWEVD